MKLDDLDGGHLAWDAFDLGSHFAAYKISEDMLGNLGKGLLELRTSARSKLALGARRNISVQDIRPHIYLFVAGNASRLRCITFAGSISAVRGIIRIGVSEGRLETFSIWRSDIEMSDQSKSLETALATLGRTLGLRSTCESYLELAEAFCLCA